MLPFKKSSFLLLLFLILSSCSSSPEPNTVIDKSGLLRDNEITALQDYNAALLKEHDIDFRLIVENENRVASAFNSRANILLQQLAGESLSKQGRMILLYIDTESDLSRLEISGDLEGVYTDIFSGYIQQQHMVYFFRKNRVRDGILAASEMIYERAREASLGKVFSEPKSILAGGGGATAAAGLSGTNAAARRVAMLATKDIQAGETPLETVMIYKLSMAAGNADPEKDIFTPSTREMMRHWTVTPAQQRNGVKGIERCSRFAHKVFFSDDNRFAVIRYPTEERQCHPWFLETDGEKWRLDLKTMQEAIGFNQKNQYHFRKQDHAYEFAFVDLRFDANGYPYD